MLLRKEDDAACSPVGTVVCQGRQASQIGRTLLSKYRCGLLFLLKKQGHQMSEDEINALCRGDPDDLDSMEIDIAEDRSRDKEKRN